MHMRQTRTLTWLAGALVVLVGAIALSEDKGSDADDDWSPLFEGADPATASRLLLEGSAQTIELAKKDGDWRLVQPFDSDADDTRVDATLRAMLKAEVGEPIESAASPGDFGLAPARVTATATMSDGKTLVLYVGDDATAGFRTYVQTTPGGDLFTTRTRIGDSLSAGVDELRTRKLVSFPVSTVDRVTIQRPGWTLDLARDAAGWWLSGMPDAPPAPEGETTSTAGAPADETAGQTEPSLVPSPIQRVRADGEAVDALLDTLNSTSADAFRDPMETELQVELSVVVRSGEESWKIEVGPDSTTGRAARVPLQPSLVTVSGILPAALASTPGDWVATGLVPVDTMVMDSIDLRLGEKSFTETREGAWSEGADKVLDALSQVRVDRMTATGEPGPQWGRVKLSTLGAEHLVTIHQEVAGGRVAVDTAGGAPFVLPATEIARIQSALP